MPEAAVDENGSAVLGQDDIWFAWELRVIYPVAKSVTPKSMTQLQLRLCGGGVDGGHIAVALLCCVNVRQYAKLQFLC